MSGRKEYELLDLNRTRVPLDPATFTQIQRAPLQGTWLVCPEYPQGVNLAAHLSEILADFHAATAEGEARP
jgi:hypothetical protein